MIDFVIISKDLRPQDLDTQVKRGAGLSNDHHIEVGSELDPMTGENTKQTKCKGVIKAYGRDTCLLAPPAELL